MKLKETYRGNLYPSFFPKWWPTGLQLRLKTYSEAYSNTSQTSKMECFTKTVNV